MERRYHTVCAEILYWEGVTLGRCLLPLSRTYFTAMAVFHSFQALKEQRIQDLTKTLYMARRSTRTFSFLLQKSGTTKAAGGKGVQWRLGSMAAEPDLEEQFCLNKSQMEQWFTLKPSIMMCTFLRNLDLIQIFDLLLPLDTCLVELEVG